MKGANRKKAEKKKAKAAEKKIRPAREYSQSRQAQPPHRPKDRTVPVFLSRNPEAWNEWQTSRS